MEDLAEIISGRLLRFAAGCIRLAGRVSRSYPGRYVADQLIRSSASSGANYQEACGAESRADFVHKLGIVLKELKESMYWLSLIREAGLATETELKPLLDEVGELTRIAAKSVITAKSRLK